MSPPARCNNKLLFDLQARLVKVVAKKALDIPLEELQFRLDTLLAIIPDLGNVASDLNINTCAWHVNGALSCSRRQGACLTQFYTHRKISWRVPCPTLAARHACHMERRLTIQVPVCADQRVVNMHPDNLAALLQDPQAVAAAVLELRKALPLVNVSALAAKMPSLLHSNVVATLPQVCSKSIPCFLFSSSDQSIPALAFKTQCQRIQVALYSVDGISCG